MPLPLSKQQQHTLRCSSFPSLPYLELICTSIILYSPFNYLYYIPALCHGWHKTNDLDTTLRGVFLLGGGLGITINLHLVHGTFWRRPATHTTYSLLNLFLYTAHFLSGSPKKTKMTSTFDTCYTLSTPAFSDFFFLVLFLCPLLFYLPAQTKFFFYLPLDVVRAYIRWHRIARVTTAMGEKKKGNGWSNNLGKEDGVTWERGGGIHLDASFGKKEWAQRLFFLPAMQAGGVSGTGWEQSLGFFSGHGT
jgi:hypothetical protein